MRGMRTSSGGGPMACTYFLMREPGEPDRILIWDTRTLSIGRAPENDLVLDSDEVSRRHALLTNEGGVMEVGDYRTGNGTFVNGKRVGEKVKIQPGAVIGIGKLELELRHEEEHPARLGHKLVYVSHLKTNSLIPQGVDAGSTMLGMVDTQPGDEPFVVEPARSTGERAFVVGSHGDAEFQMRAFDDGLDDLSLELDDGPGGAPSIDLPDDDPLVGAGLPGADLSGAAAPAPDPDGQSGFDPIERMRKLKSLHEAGLITDEEFAAKRAEILSQV